MKLRKLFSMIMALALVCTCFVSTAGCGGDITKAQATLQIYNYSDAEFYDEADVKMSIDLYGHLAPKTVNAMTKYINEGYYDNALIYRMTDFNQIMVGDLILADGAEGVVIEDDGATVNIIQNPVVKPTLDGEFEIGGTTGSNLKNEKGSIGLWRSWYSLGLDWLSSAATKTGRATWFMPTESLASYNGYFCVFAKLALDVEETKTAFNALNSIFTTSSSYTTFIVYYTGTYDNTKADQNHGLTFNIVTQEYFNSLSEEQVDQLGIFKAEGQQLECYNQFKVRIPNNSTTGKCGAMVKKVRTV